MQYKKPELLAPAGDFESLEAAVCYGADAVYLGGTAFSMRTSPQNFSAAQLAEAVSFAHAHGVRVYLTCNTLPRNEEFAGLPRFFEEAARAKVDAFILSDLGVLDYARRYAPHIELHASTQTGIVNFAAANALFRMGAKRVVLARELSLSEIAVLRDNTPRSLEIEAFVHGAMCMSFSGRCLLSSYINDRDANRGSCSQPCRWNYSLMEQRRPGEYFPVVEENGGTHIMNARDLCMIGHIPELVEAGISSLKIEGRAKSAYYVAVVTNAYRIALDAWFNEGAAYQFDPALQREVEKVSHRSYCTGFYYGPIEKGQLYDESYVRNWDVAAVVEEGAGENGLIRCLVRNLFRSSGSFEAVEPGRLGRPVTIRAIYGERGERLDAARHPNGHVLLDIGEPLAPHSILRQIAE